MKDKHLDTFKDGSIMLLTFGSICYGMIAVYYIENPFNNFFYIMTGLFLIMSVTLNIFINNAVVGMVKNA